MPDQLDPTQDRRGKSVWPHRVALLTACSTLPLLFIGGLVTSKGAGLAVPDWPTTFGYNMFLYPWSKMVGPIFYEHSHRLVASGVGFLTVILALLLWLRERRNWLRWLGVIALALVIVQGLIGGLRVVLLKETLAIIHACFAQAFFALTVSLVLFTSKEWREMPQKSHVADAGRVQRLCLFTTSIIFLQGLFGAVLRYTGTRLDAHLIFAALVILHVVLLSARILRFHGARPGFYRPVVFLCGLLFLQLALGLGSYVGRFAPLGMALPPLAVEVLTTTHLVTGALMLVTSLVITLRSYRLLIPLESLVGRGFFSEQVST